MHIQQFTPQLLNLIKYAQKDKALELEVRVKESINNSITSDMFYSTLKRIKGMNFIKFVGNKESLDISIKDSDLRITIHGNDNIIQYCQTNDIKSVNPAFIEIIKKTPVKNVDLNDYKIRFNLKREILVDIRTPEIITLFKKWNSLEKIFRYKNRKSFKTVDNLFMYDLTILKSSNKKIVTGDNTYMKKRLIKPYMKKYVVKPDYVVDFEEWFSKIGDDDDVEMKGRKNIEYILSKNLQKSNVLKNNLEYEIELEYLGNKINFNEDHKSILMRIIQNVVIILQSIQKSYYIISESTKSRVIDEYKLLMKDYKFKGPMSVTLEKKHIVEKNYEDYQNTVNIRRGYSVTDKADGERNLLIIIGNGEMYLLNRKNVVKFLGASCVELANSIFDCEYIMKDKNGKNINLVMLFDAYFVKSIDYRNNILQRTVEEIESGVVPESRYEVLTTASEIIHDKIVLNPNNTLKILKKKFYYGDDIVYDPSVLDDINFLESQLLKLDVDDPQYKNIKQQLELKKKDTKIFKEIEKVLSRTYIYKTDGIIFTPRYLKVGEEPGGKKKNYFDGRWYSCFKWKPPEENTIDFLVKIKKDPKNQQKDLIKYINEGDTIIAYKTLILCVGYNPEIHTRYNSCRILNENIMFENKYVPVPFNPTEPYIKESQYAFIPIKSDNIYTEDDNNIITENCIIECKYNKDSFFKWTPLRIRDNLKPNDFVTASNVWNSINNPVTLDLIKSGNVDKSNYGNIYYNRNIKRSNRECNPMYDFHSLVKKTLITENVTGNKNLLDMSVGKGGDINHWVDSEVNFCVGLDINKDNLINIDNGACNRIFNKVSELQDGKLAEKTLMIWADSSKNILNGSAGQDDLHKYYLDILYGNIDISEINNGKLRTFYNLGNGDKKGFDNVSCQFSIHYFFKDKDSINTFINNVSQSLKRGGIFIGTCLDGEKVFNSLKDRDIISNISESKNICWKITKKYDKSTFTNSDESLGLKIDVYHESIGASFPEYLVNFNYLISICKEYGLELIKLQSFEELFESLSSVDYGSIKSMNDELKRYSFMNNAFVFQKK